MADLARPIAPRMGTLHGISLGPGDPGLITRAAWAALGAPQERPTSPM